MEFRYQFFPYCLIQQADGSYAVVNRRYKPIGFNTTDWVDYSAFPVTVKIRGIGPATAAKLSWNQNTSTDRIYLYNDGTIPTSSRENMAAYLDRLATLASMKVE